MKILGEYMFCGKCGHENRNDRKFCMNCGASLRDYTQPRENLLMPDDVKEQHEQALKHNRSIIALNITMWVLFVISIVFVVVSFFIGKVPQLILAIGAVVVLITFLILAVIRNRKVKNNSKKE